MIYARVASEAAVVAAAQTVYRGEVIEQVILQPSRCAAARYQRQFPRHGWVILWGSALLSILWRAR